MRCRLVAELLRAVSRFAVIGVVGGLAGACSTDTMRFSENPFANPYAGPRTASAGRTPDPSMTGSIDRPAKAAAMPSSAPGPFAASPTNPMPHESYASSMGGPGWSAAGGTAVTVSQGDSLSAISDRYGVPQSAILSANGISAGQVAPGRRLIIPIYNASGPNVVARAPKPTPQAPLQAVRQAAPQAAPRAVPQLARAPRPVTHVAATAPVKAPARVAEARKVATEPKTTASIDAKAHPRPGRPTVLAKAVPVQATPAKVAVARPAKPEPARKVAKLEPAPVATSAKIAKVQAAKVEVAKADVPKPIKVAQPAKPPKPEPQRVAALAPAKTAQPEPLLGPKEPESTGTLPVQPSIAKAEFRWPARGRVISGFGGTGTNEGINISVPDGTPVKAAEAGTVAYAGSEVKGYGNLVLIRHDNGYVSAYAHNGDLDVKRGQKVTRGQVIAKSGQSGNVTSPQLHFEIRKGATPIDPMPYLASN